MYDLIIKNATIVNEGKEFVADLAINNGRIDKIQSVISDSSKVEVDGTGKHLLPGVIDDQVHFRDPGFPHKGSIATESLAAVAGGVTTFMEMPNTNPQTTNFDELAKKFEKADKVSPANFSFFFGATNDNLELVKQVDSANVCGIKIFMGSSTGNMLVDNQKVLEQIFKHSPTLIATHCEDEATIRNNAAEFREKYGDSLNATHHPQIRNVDGCYISSSKAIELARATDARLHILHISTAKETALFGNDKPLIEKRITAEACVHHMYFNDSYYPTKGNLVKCNPAIKTEQDRKAIFQALLDDRIDIIATDHAPHSWDEKSKHYSQAPSGLPLVQHSLNIMMNFVEKREISLTDVVRKMSHAPADCFRINERGYIREGYYADLVLVDLKASQVIHKNQLKYHCGWSPLEGEKLAGKVQKTWVNGVLVFDDSLAINFTPAGMPITFNSTR